MVTLRQRTTVVTGKPEPKLEKERLRQITTVVTGEPERKLEEERLRDDSTIVLDVSDDSSSDSAVKQLRGRWELASVLNFLNVFGPLVSGKLKLTAEEIEMSLINSNTTNAQLHIALLKGIPPVNKSVEDENAWITVLCKILAPWWPWIAEGEIPITASKGEEISEYQGLDPTTRLKFLKALCEIRVQQDDARSYIQENTKEGDCDSRFRKRKLGGDGKKTSYWFDGNDIQGYRLYREVNEISKSAKARNNSCSDKSGFYWETEATNLDEFQRVARELSSSKDSSLAATGGMVEAEAIPVVEKYHKKKEAPMKKKMKQEEKEERAMKKKMKQEEKEERAMKKKMKQEEKKERAMKKKMKQEKKEERAMKKKMKQEEEERAMKKKMKQEEKKERAMKKKMKQEKVANVNSSRPIRRSFRNRIPASYTFDEYDKMIDEAVEEETEESDQDDEEGKEQESGWLGSNGSSEGKKMKSTEDVKENGKITEEAEPKREFIAKNRLRKRVTRNSALC